MRRITIFNSQEKQCRQTAVIASIGEICWLVGLIASLIFSTASCRADSAPAHAVASAHPLATAAGVEILREGGTHLTRPLR